jgi:alkanesulfonate monooxygenase SsuD/methylene tetrahydromethanopterin reductase-like flavin-dependent oxidoreductase (luciferase family)
VRVVDFEGRYFRSRGPLNTARPPQGRPALVQAGGSPKGRDLAARWGDSVIGYVKTTEQMREYRDDIRARAAAFGRDPDDVKVLFLLTPFLGETEAEARSRRERLLEEAHAHPEVPLSMQGFLLGIDLSLYDLDTPLRDLADQLASNGHQSILAAMLAAAGDRTLREVAIERRHAEVMGTPDQAADQMAAMMEEVGGDGFLITLPLAELNRRGISEVTDGLVPALQRRGLVRTEYLPGTLRDNLRAF